MPATVTYEDSIVAKCAAVSYLVAYIKAWRYGIKIKEGVVDKKSAHRTKLSAINANIEVGCVPLNENMIRQSCLFLCL